MKSSAEGDNRVNALLGIEAIFGNELPLDGVFIDAVMSAYLTLLEKGAKATVAQYAAAI
ncbi:D-mannonate oxidoreductase [Leclercia adecarboxylata]|uniref:D-mannonate oxidoreductase n=1 Tax=Leclercia adecarboxylata TaxID=83655 RepID=A0A4U9HTX8_9ENTR|nr:D-mannonate oxidoreductase [Leclercia adecarboxylata]